MTARARRRESYLGGLAGWAAAALYARGVAFAHRRALEHPRVRTRRPVVSIGNLVVGGTGKTPCTVWLASRLTAEGRAVAIVARPVGAPVPDAEGDEIAVLRELAPGTPVFAARDKSEGARRADEALASATGGVVIVDDAFSHWKLERAFDLVLLDAERPIGNGHLLPLGPLREPPTALARASAIVLTRADRLAPDALAKTRDAVRSLAPGVPVASARIVPLRITVGGHGAPVTIPDGQPTVCLSGLANPGDLAHAATALGLSVVEDLCYPDHHAFGDREWEAARTRAEHAGAWLVTSRKDAVRLTPERRAFVRVLDVGFGFLDGEDDVLERMRRVLL